MSIENGPMFGWKIVMWLKRVLVGYLSKSESQSKNGGNSSRKGQYIKRCTETGHGGEVDIIFSSFSVVLRLNLQLLFKPHNKMILNSSCHTSSWDKFSLRTTVWPINKGYDQINLVFSVHQHLLLGPTTASHVCWIWRAKGKVAPRVGLLPWRHHWSKNKSCFPVVSTAEALCMQSSTCWISAL